MQDKEVKEFLSKKYTSNSERKELLSKALLKFKNASEKYPTSLKAGNASTNSASQQACVVFVAGFIFVGYWLFILGGVFVYAGAVVFVG